MCGQGRRGAQERGGTDSEAHTGMHVHTHTETEKHEVTETQAEQIPANRDS